MKSIAVFCGSSSGSNGVYMEKATSMGKILARRNIRIVYGGAKVGLMGALSDSALIDQLSDGAIALPGGFGTLDELFEMLTWGQLGLHKKPVGILNINRFFSDLIRVIETMVNEGFLKEINRDMVIVSDEIEELLEKMIQYRAPLESKWIHE